MQVLRVLASTALADAQQLTLLRAVVKGNQPALIAAIAADTAQLYSLAGSQVGAEAVKGGWPVQFRLSPMCPGHSWAMAAPCHWHHHNNNRV